MLNLTL